MSFSLYAGIRCAICRDFVRYLYEGAYYIPHKGYACFKCHMDFEQSIVKEHDSYMNYYNKLGSRDGT